MLHQPSSNITTVVGASIYHPAETTFVPGLLVDPTPTPVQTESPAINDSPD